MTFIVKNECRQLKPISKECYESYLVVRDDAGFVKYLNEVNESNKVDIVVKEIELALVRLNRAGISLGLTFAVFYILGFKPPFAWLATAIIIVGIGLSFIGSGLRMRVIDENKH